MLNNETLSKPPQFNRTLANATEPPLLLQCFSL